MRAPVKVRDAVLQGGGGAAELAQLREDEPHPAGGLAAGVKLGDDAGPGGVEAGEIGHGARAAGGPGRGGAGCGVGRATRPAVVRARRGRKGPESGPGQIV